VGRREPEKAAGGESEDPEAEASGDIGTSAAALRDGSRRRLVSRTTALLFETGPVDDSADGPVPLLFETDPVDDSADGPVPLLFETNPVDDSADGPVPLFFETGPVDDSADGRVPLLFETGPVDDSADGRVRDVETDPVGDPTADFVLCSGAAAVLDSAVGG
jgi:hypothetical protein